MALIIISILCIGLCYKWGDWRNWRLYYPTMLFYVIGQLTETIITDDKTLWSIHGLMWNDALADYFMAFFIFPFIIILFLSNYPKKITRQILRILIFVFALSLIEYTAQISNVITYHNGWSFGWSILLYIGMLPLLRLHYKNSLLALVIFFALIGTGIVYFGIPIGDLK